MKDPKDWNIPEMVQAVIDDDPEAESIRESLTKALKEAQAGEFARTTYLSETAEARHEG